MKLGLKAALARRQNSTLGRLPHIYGHLASKPGPKDDGVLPEIFGVDERVSLGRDDLEPR